jgi:hypothetical protein
MTALCKKQFLNEELGRVNVCEIKCIHPERGSGSEICMGELKI